MPRVNISSTIKTRTKNAMFEYLILPQMHGIQVFTKLFDFPTLLCLNK